MIGAAAVLTGCGSDTDGKVINLYNAPQENLGQIVERCNEMADGDYHIRLNTLPRDADGQREQMVRRLAAADSGMDVLGIDVTWTAELASADWILPWPDDVRAKAEEGVLEAPLTTATYEDELYAAPYNTNVQLLWYRTDLMPEPAQTWDELVATAQRLEEEQKPHHVEVTGAQYEGLVVWFNSMVAAAGGAILNKEGDAVELGQPAVEALEDMRDFARSPAANPSMSNTQEDQARLAMENGSSFAQINWPFVYASMVANRPDIAENFAWAPYPGIDGPGNAPLGGANFASSMTNINAFFPQREKGWALGLNAGGGNLGVATIQVVGLLVIALAGNRSPHWVIAVYLVLLVIAGIGAALRMDNLADQTVDVQSMKDLARDKDAWVLSLLYIGTFGSFIGFSFAFGQMLTMTFVGNGQTPGQAALHAAQITFLGPLLGSLTRMAGGRMSDRFGGARVTLVTFCAMAVTTLALVYTSVVQSAGGGTLSGGALVLFFAAFLTLFGLTGVGNASVYKLIPSVYEARSHVV